MTLPRSERTERWIDPVPWQMSQVTGEVPGWQQEPWQVSQVTAVSTSMSRWVPKIDLLEADLDADERVLAALAPRAGPSGLLAGTEERLEDVAEPAEALAAEAALAAAEVVLLALLGIGEHVVRVRHRLEPLGCLGTGVHVGVEFARQAAVRLLDLVWSGVTRDAEDLVVVCHGGRVLSIAGCRMGFVGGGSQLSPRVRER